MKKLLGLLTLTMVLSTTNAHATSAEWGYISQPISLSGGGFVFSHSGPRSTPLPSCATTEPSNQWAFNANTPEGQAMLSTLLSAYSLHKRIGIVGLNTCASTVGDREAISYLYLED